MPPRPPKCRLDVTEIAPNLWQGSAPPGGDDVAKCGFDMLVLSAKEYQPSKGIFLRVPVVIYAPLDDSGPPMTGAEWQTARMAGADVARFLWQGKKVLVTCLAGRNRSGLISAIALHILTGRSGDLIVGHIQSLRPNALTNPYFNAALSELKSAP